MVPKHVAAGSAVLKPFVWGSGIKRPIPGTCKPYDIAIVSRHHLSRRQRACGRRGRGPRRPGPVNTDRHEDWPAGL
jgi:hypothetical protein